LVKNNRDFFRDRVMFSIHNLSGKVIAFAGRILQKDPKAPKYINSPETEIYFKSKVLYGLYFAKQAIRREDECLLVEGYTDVISLHQAGIENAVASSGTSLTVDQIRLVKRYTPNVTLLFDGDAAGLKAALRGVDLLLEQDLNVRVVVLPDGEDPDSFVQKMGLTVTREFIAANKKDFILFKAGLLLGEAGNDPVKKADLVKDIIASIALIPDPIKRSIYAKECARLFSMDEMLVVAAINQKVASGLQKEQQKKTSPQAADPQGSTVAASAQGVGAADENRAVGHDFQERDLARVLILFGKEWYDEREGLTVGRFVIDNIEDVIEAFDNKLYLRVAQDVQQRLQQQQPLLSPQEYVRHEQEDIRQLALDLLGIPNELSENWEKKWGIILNQVHPDANWKEDSEQMIKRFRLRKLKRVLEQNLVKIKEAEASGNAEQIVVFLKLHHRIKAIHDELARQVKTVIG
jgi:DNA primase